MRTIRGLPFTLISLALAGLAACVSLSSMSGPEYDALSEALSARWNSDDTIPTASFGFDTNSNGDRTETWLAIELSYTVDCAPAGDDPCDELANELAQIVFDSYAKVDELTGILIVIGSQPHELYVDPADIKFEKALTVTEWRSVLALPVE